eukprot:517547-Prymnesium_polylepis.1
MYSHIGIWSQISGDRAARRCSPQSASMCVLMAVTADGKRAGGNGGRQTSGRRMSGQQTVDGKRCGRQTGGRQTGRR